MNKKRIIVANWKMNPGTEKEAVKLARQEDFKNVVIAPPFLFLKIVWESIRKAALASQDVFWEENGPYTGEISAQQLKSVGVSYVIIGHSERRALGETDGIINKKVKAALKAGLKVILCVGENWDIKKGGINAVKKFVKKQLEKDLQGIRNWKLEIRNLLIAYEPVWAIGTGRVDKPAETVEMAKFIKSFLNSKFRIQNSKLLYGGSVTSKNVSGFLSQKEIDGVLVGGSSLRAEDFRRIVVSNQ